MADQKDDSAVLKALLYLKNMMQKPGNASPFGNPAEAALDKRLQEGTENQPPPSPAPQAPGYVPPMGGAIGGAVAPPPPPPPPPPAGQLGLAPSTTETQRAQGIAALVARGISPAQAAQMIDAQMRK